MTQSVKRHLLTWTTRVQTRPVYTGFVVDRVGMGQVCSEYFRHNIKLKLKNVTAVAVMGLDVL